MEDILGVMIPLSAVILSLGMAIYRVHLKHQDMRLFHTERMSAIEKGIDLPKVEDFFGKPVTTIPPNDQFLYRGLLWSLIGAGIFLFFAVLSLSLGEDGPPLGVAFLGTIPVGVGVANLLFYKKRETQKGMNKVDSALNDPSKSAQ